MTNMKKKFTIFVMLIFCYAFNAAAQQNDVASILVQDGKINAVIAVVSILLTGFFILLFVLERKVKQLEK